jgi:hypothetical protein
MQPNFKLGKSSKTPSNIKRYQLADLREGMLQRMADGEIIDHIETQRGHAQAAVGRDRHVELLRFFPERIEFRTAIEPSAGRHRG